MGSLEETRPAVPQALLAAPAVLQGHLTVPPAPQYPRGAAAPHRPPHLPEGPLGAALRNLLLLSSHLLSSHLSTRLPERLPDASLLL